MFKCGTSPKKKQQQEDYSKLSLGDFSVKSLKGKKVSLKQFVGIT